MKIGANQSKNKPPGTPKQAPDRDKKQPSAGVKSDKARPTTMAGSYTHKKPSPTLQSRYIPDPRTSPTRSPAAKISHLMTCSSSVTHTVRKPTHTPPSRRMPDKKTDPAGTSSATYFFSPPTSSSTAHTVSQTGNKPSPSPSTPSRHMPDKKTTQLAEAQQLTLSTPTSRPTAHTVSQKTNKPSLSLPSRCMPDKIFSPVGSSSASDIVNQTDNKLPQSPPEDQKLRHHQHQNPLEARHCPRTN